MTKINILFQDIPSTDQIRILKDASELVDKDCKILFSLKTQSISQQDYKEIAKKIEKELNLDFVYCNLLHRENGNFKGTLDYLVPTWGKHEKIQEICRLFKICPKEICHIGDNENDISVGERVGLFISFNPKTEKIKQKAKNIIYDFRELNKILEFYNGNPNIF